MWNFAIKIFRKKEKTFLSGLFSADLFKSCSHRNILNASSDKFSIKIFMHGNILHLSNDIETNDMEIGTTGTGVFTNVCSELISQMPKVQFEILFLLM